MTRRCCALTAAKARRPSQRDRRAEHLLVLDWRRGAQGLTALLTPSLAPSPLSRSLTSSCLLDDLGRRTRHSLGGDKRQAEGGAGPEQQSEGEGAQDPRRKRTMVNDAFASGGGNKVARPSRDTPRPPALSLGFSMAAQMTGSRDPRPGPQPVKTPQYFSQSWSSMCLVFYPISGR